MISEFQNLQPKCQTAAAGWMTVRKASNKTGKWRAAELQANSRTVFNRKIESKLLSHAVSLLSDVWPLSIYMLMWDLPAEKLV